MKRELVRTLMPVLQAFVDGKEIEGRPKGFSNDFEGWMIVDAISNLDSIEYRIKPEPKYRPFANAEECWAEMCKHHPFGWVKTKSGTHRLIVLIDEERLMMGAQSIEWSYRTLFNEQFTFVDGTPFGVKVEK